MDRSEHIHEFATALAKAQGAIEAAEKDKTNSHFKSRYADLASVREAIRIPLSSNGICYVQAVRTVDRGIEIETMLCHSSGQYVSEVLMIPVPNMNAQTIGSASTYGKRFALMGMVGVAADGEDDDGNEASAGAPFETRKPVAEKEPAASSKAINLGREIRSCKSLADLSAFKATDEFQAAWKAMNGVDKAHVANIADKRKAELDTPFEAEREPEKVEG